MRLLWIILLSVCCSAQTVVTQFDGDVNLTGTPPDHPNMGMDSNGTYVMEITWQNVSIFNTAGVLQSATRTLTFLNAAGGVTCASLTPGEGRVIYDRFISRWLMTTACSNGDYFLVSSGSNPTTSTWKGVTLTANTGDLLMHMGYDKNWVYESEFQTCSGASKATEVAVPQGDVAWSGGGTIVLTHEVISTCHSFEAIPSIDLNPSKGVTTPGYFWSNVSHSQNATNQTLTLAVDTFTPTTATAGTFNAGASPATVATSYLYNTPVDTGQPGSPSGIRSVESSRPFSPTTINGTDMQMTFGSGPCTTSGTCTQGLDTQQLFYWFDVAIPGLTMIQQAKISNSSVGYMFPTLAMDSSNNTVFSATGCSTSVFCSIYTWTHLASDASGVINGPTLATSGTANYQVCNVTPHPGWGDYATMAQDPADPTKVWAVAEYANSATVCKWYTRILELQPVVIPPGVSATGNFNGVAVWGSVK